MLTRLIAAALAVATTATVSHAQPAPEAVVAINTERPGPVIDRNIYGHFAEHLGRGIFDGIWVGPDSRMPNIKGYRRDVVEALRHLRVPVIRWPGGCFSEAYDWRDGIGPRAKRPVRTRMHWSDTVDRNDFGTHEYLDFVELIGADAYVSGNVGSMSPRDMQLWYEYMTADNDSTLANERRRNGRAKPWKIKYFGIGNETWGCGGNMRPDYAADVNARYSAFVDPPKSAGLVKVASGASVQGGGDFEAFTDAMMRHRGQTDALSFHYYAMPMDRPKSEALAFGEDDWADVLDLAREMDPMLKRVTAIMDKYDPEKRVPLFVDEWGAWYKPDAASKPGEHHFQQNSLRDAMVAALTFNIFHRHSDRVKMANIAQMVNVLQAILLTDGDKMVLTPTYHLFDLYKPFMNATPFPTSVATPEYIHGRWHMPMVDVTAAKATDGKTYLALVNVDPDRAVSVSTLSGKKGTGRILTAEAMNAHNSFEHPDRIKPIPFSGEVQNGRLTFNLPAKSIAVVEVD